MGSNKIEHCHPILREKWPTIQDAVVRTFPGWKIRLVCTHRPPEEQFEDFKKGRKLNRAGYWELVEPEKRVTNCDGTVKVSKHNLYPAEAFDVVLVEPTGRINYDFKNKQWQALPLIAKALDLKHGSEFKGFKNAPGQPDGDWPHFELGTKSTG